MKKFSLIIMILVLGFVLVSCKKEKEWDFAEGKFVTLSVTPKGTKEERLSYTLNIDIYDNGDFIISTTDFYKWYDGDLPLPDKYSLTSKWVNDIKDAIKKEKLVDSHKDVGNKTNMVGELKSLTIYTTAGDVEIYGINPSNESFNLVYDMIFERFKENRISYCYKIDCKLNEGISKDIGFEIYDDNDNLLFNNDDVKNIYYEAVDADENEESADTIKTENEESADTTKTDNEESVDTTKTENATSSDAADTEYIVIIELDKKKTIAEIGTNTDAYATQEVYKIFADTEFVDNALVVDASKGYLRLNSFFNEKSAKEMVDKLKENMKN